jgi:hypothetical protein
MIGSLWSAGADFYAGLPVLRTIVNLPVTSVAKGIAHANGGSCLDANYKGLIVCSVPQGKGIQGGSTYGDVFITDKPIDDLSAAQLRALYAHELRHSEQWAAGGPVAFPIAYGLESAWSQISTGTYGCANFFEFEAGFVEGNYSARCNTK